LAIRKLYDEQAVLENFRHGEPEAFELIFNTYWDQLYELAYFKLKSSDKAEEIVQDVFFSLWEKRQVLLIDNISSYLLTSTRNRTIDYIRAQIRKRKHWEYYKMFLPVLDESADKFFKFNELNNSLDKALNDLPEKTRKIFRWNRLEGKSISEIADQLHLSEKSIEYHLTKSVKQLRTSLKDFILLLAIAVGIHNIF
jgi:RNA polymerase sigma-70 factor (family 1)